ncbi:gastrula zinc finger protein XlCGF8.2DB-like [Chrysoperla carnea]|uniref:gastrula zinc finger protein XlCGF8.2DB-like n=1 Tax=Chrysoperla carnea TaxID=189513 RepID=UPI001D06CE4A|nr:gastrula zinc finger protein XlCGF8.2DB-like [Chrysoperla carnea]
MMSKDVCKQCYKKVVDIYEFHQQIIQAQEKLKLQIAGYNDPEMHHHILYDNSSVDNSEDENDTKTLRNLKSNLLSRTVTKSDLVPSTKLKLKRVKLKDTDNQTFLCDKCGKCYKTKYQLISHLKSHNNDKPFKCDECSKTYKNPAVHRHKLIHNGIKPFVCEICGNKFRLQGMLTMHSLIHTGVLPHECSYCKKRFRRIDFLKGHLRQHTGERPYSCTECNHFFSNGSNFIKHLKVRHGLQNVSITNRFQFPFIDT